MILIIITDDDIQQFKNYYNIFVNSNILHVVNNNYNNNFHLCVELVSCDNNNIPFTPHPTTENVTQLLDTQSSERVDIYSFVPK